MALRYSTILALAVAGSANANVLQKRADCPGVDYAAETNGVSTSACCVGGAVPSVFLSVCEGWPICKGPTTTTTTSTPLSCVTLLPFSDANYAADLSSITASMAASGTTYCTTIGVAGNKCNAAQTATSTGSSSSTKTSSSTSASSTAASASSNSGNTNANGVGGDASGSGGSDTTSGNGADASVSISSSATSAITMSSQGGSGGSSSSSTTTTTTSTKSGASAFGMGWQSWALGVFGLGPAVLAILL